MKSAIRKQLLERRNSISSEGILRKSKKIKRLLFRLPEYKKAKSVLFYVSKSKEVCTIEMIKEALKEKTVAVPKTDKKNKKLILSKIKSLGELKEGCFGILEPVKINKIEMYEIDLIIVPGVAFDRECRRIGHGHGYYDRLLSKAKAPKIGLALESQIVDRIPAEPHDVEVNKVVTEERIIEC
ncbi:5-formyltetrahydrofolate cyclo-ligase [Candidatus Woesearchaeota archaeon]|nr:5-formyltetrahydrofolate cyclo-ligase [Candidatus Woesearchaeota archaeon]